MAPVFQMVPKDREKEKPRRPGEKRSELICKVKYCNTLPDFAFDPKFITYPFESTRFVQYKPTSLEKSHKHDLLTEQDLGVNIDLINPDTYSVSLEQQSLGMAIPLPIEDEKLLEEETLTPNDHKRSRHHNKVVPWLKKTEYISTEFNRYGASSEKTETKVGYNVKKLWNNESPYMDKESQIAAINKTFEDAKKPITSHPGKRGVTPLQVFEVFPDFSLWKYPFAQVQFDADPAPMSRLEEMSQAMIRGVMDESGEQFVAYFLPTQETLEKRRRDKEQGIDYVEEEEYEYDMTREYNWNVKNKSSKGYEENYFFVFRDDGVYYNELETRVRLSKRRAKGDSHASNSKLVVKHRALTDSEFKSQDMRLRLLQPPQEEEEEEDDTQKDKEQNINSHSGQEEEEEDEAEEENEDDDDEDGEDEEYDDEEDKENKQSKAKGQENEHDDDDSNDSEDSGSSSSSLDDEDERLKVDEKEFSKKRKIETEEEKDEEEGKEDSDDEDSDNDNSNEGNVSKRKKQKVESEEESDDDSDEEDNNEGKRESKDEENDSDADSDGDSDSD